MRAALVLSSCKYEENGTSAPRLRHAGSKKLLALLSDQTRK